MRDIQVRPFEERDYERVIEIGNAIEPEAPRSLEVLRYQDATWNPEYRQARMVADQKGRLAGWAQVGHLWFAPHPRRFGMRIEVEPRHEREGIGSALYQRCMALVQQWDPELVRAEAKQPRGIGFLERHGFSEVQRRWLSHLVVKQADLTNFEDVEQRVIGGGIRISTFAAESAQRGEPLVAALHEVEVAAAASEPRPEGDAVMSQERFVVQELNGPGALPDGHFLALDGERVVGLSRLRRDVAQPGVLEQGFTAVHPDYRGRGIAVALKLSTVRYALKHGYREIHTQNDVTNAPMLRINDALGFQKRAPVMVYERKL
jgi:GNAT superfamily N-acetyltransferase